ncbi:MAG: SurA N-terminal domain-containing protein [Gammaproteobacteria bacterium]
MIKQIQVGLILLGTLLLGTSAFAAKAHQQSLDGIVATVNDIVIAQSEVDQASNAIKKQMMSANAPSLAANVLRKQVIEQLINRKLQLQIADQTGIHATDQQIDKAIATIASENNASVTELYQKIVEQGLSKTDYRKEIREELVLQQIQQQEVGSKVVMTPDDVKNFLRSKTWAKSVPVIKEYQVTDILINLPESATPTDIANAQKHAQEVFQKLHNGTNYQDIAASDKALTQNDLGWRKLQEIPSAFAGRVAQMKKGEIANPIQTPNGLHILQLTSVRTAAPEKNDIQAPSEDQAKQMVYQRKFEESLKKWVAKLRTQAVINIGQES